MPRKPTPIRIRITAPETYTPSVTIEHTMPAWMGEDDIDAIMLIVACAYQEHHSPGTGWLAAAVPLRDKNGARLT